jgi:hypothetical protein
LLSPKKIPSELITKSKLVEAGVMLSNFNHKENREGTSENNLEDLE